MTNEQIAEIIINRDAIKKAIIQDFKDKKYHGEKQLSAMLLYFQCDYYYEQIKKQNENA